MALTLTVTSPQCQTLGQNSRLVIGEQGCVIGRAQGKGNDWVLPDPGRFLSSKHANIFFQDGVYYLTDTSTNGVFINGAKQPVGRDNAVQLNNGDQLMMGDYEILVTIDSNVVTDRSDSPFGDTAGASIYEEQDLVITSSTGRMGGMPDQFAYEPEMPAEQAWDQVESNDWLSEEPFIKPSENLAGAEPDHSSAMNEYFRPPDSFAEQIPDDWDLADLSGDKEKPLTFGEEIPSGFAPQKPHGIRPASGSAAFGGGAIPASKAVQQEHNSFTPEMKVPMQGPAGDMSRQTSVVPGSSGAAGVGLAAFLRGVGLNGADFPAVDESEMMEMYGRIFRDVVQGLMEILMARTSLKSEFRMSLTTIRPVENNPLKFSVNVDEALRNLMVVQDRSYLSPADALQESFDDIKRHQMAMVGGMQVAFQNMLQRFDPKAFEATFEKTPKSALQIAMNKKSRYWEMYSSFYKNITKDAEESFQQLFGEEFARAYEEQVQQLAAARGKKSSF